MTDPFRSGGFGSIGFGPFKTGGGGDSRYLIANDGNAVASTRKYSAQVAWANGTITDDAYLKELARYLKTTDKGSRERIAAQNEYDDARYTIGRNKIVREVNNASTTVGRTDALRRLMGYDRAKLATMKPDNEQYRELQDNIADAGKQIRDVRYADMVRKFNRGDIGISAMLRYSRNALADSAGQPDNTDWKDRVNEWQGRASDEKLAQLYQDYEHERIPGSTVISFLREKLGTLSPDSPEYHDTQRTIEDLSKRIREDGFAKRDASMSERVQQGDVSNREYLTYLKGRIDDYAVGSADRRTAKDNFLNATFSIGERSLQTKISQGTADGSDLIDFYRANMATMNPGSSRFLDLQQRVSDLLLQGTTTLDFLRGDLSPKGGGGGGGGGTGPSGGYGGHWIDLGGSPGGTPVDAQGFASQFDGSQFANTNCAMASAAMLAWAASGGKVKVSGGDLRYYSGDTDRPGDELGTSFGDIAIAFNHVGLGLEQKHGMNFEAFKRRLINGDGAIIDGSYSVVPSGLSLQSGYGGDHSMYVDKAVKKDGKWFFWVMDPLGRAGYEGRWWPEAAVKAYGWSNITSGGGNGNTWYGDVAFAARKGSSSATYVAGPSRSRPPYQAFDTDAQGHSTVGRGGGTNRQEAGPRRDWSKGRRNEPRATFTGSEATGGRAHKGRTGVAVDDGMIDEFLAAVHAAKSPLAVQTTWGGDERGTQAERARARVALSVNGGDARLAAVQWFTGRSPDRDTGTWNASERFYANAVGTRLGYATIPKAGVGNIHPAEPPNPMSVATEGPRPIETQRAGDVGNVEPEAAKMGTMLLRQLGIRPTPDMVRAAMAWIETESGGKITGNNPLGLHTKGSTDLPGQLTRDPNGLAIFGSVEEGISAAADEIKRTNPGIVAGGNSGDPERFLVAIDRSRWTQGGYGGGLVRTYNALPGDPTNVIIGGAPGILQGAGDLKSLARQEPGLAELFDIDPRDPVQVDWLQANIDAAKQSLESGADTWTFTTGGGKQVELDFNPTMVGELTMVKALYADWTAATLSRSGAPEYRKALDAAKDAHNEHDRIVADVSVDEWRGYTDAIDKSRQMALGQGDIASYIRYTQEMDQATRMLLGVAPDAPKFVVSELLKGRTDISADDKKELISFTEGIDPRSPENASGDKIMGMYADGIIVGQKDAQGKIIAAAIPADQGYLQWDTNGGISPVTVADKWEDFQPVPVTAADQTGTTTQAYKLGKVLVMVDGRAAWADVTPGVLPGSVLETTYRTTVIPGKATQNSLPMGRLMGQQSSGLVDPTGLSGNYQLPGIPVTPPQLTTVSTATRQDKQVVTLPGDSTVQVNVIRLKGRTGYQIRGSTQILWVDDSKVQGNSPFLVIDTSPGSGLTVVNGNLMLGDKLWNGQDDISKYVHWYGTGKDDLAPNDSISVGARDTVHRLRETVPLPGGGIGVGLDPSSVDQAWLEGDIPATEMAQYAAGRMDTTPSERVARTRGEGIARGTSRYAPGEPGTERARAAAAGQQPVAPTPGLVRWSLPGGPTNELGQPLGNTVYQINVPPMNAGQAPPTTPPIRGGSLLALADKMSAGVRAYADAAVKSAAAQATIAREQAATQARLNEIKLAAARAALQKANQEMAARRAATTAARGYTTPTPSPSRRRLPSLGYTPIGGAKPRPKPTPEPAPKPAPKPTPAPLPPWGGDRRTPPKPTPPWTPPPNPHPPGSY